MSILAINIVLIALGCFFGGAIAGMFISRRRMLSRLRSAAVIARIRPGDGRAIGVLVDVNEGKVSFQPLEKSGPTSYTSIEVSKDTPPATVSVLPGDRVYHDEDTGAPVIFGYGVNPFYIYLPPEDLVVTGIGSKVIPSSAWSGSSLEGDVTKLLVDLARASPVYKGEIKLDPRAKVTVSVPIPPILKAIIATIARGGATASLGISDVTESFREWKETALRARKAERAYKLKLIFYIAIAVVLIAIGISIVMGGGPSLPVPKPPSLPVPKPQPPTPVPGGGG